MFSRESYNVSFTIIHEVFPSLSPSKDKKKNRESDGHFAGNGGWPRAAREAKRWNGGGVHFYKLRFLRQNCHTYFLSKTTK